jgi:hypothetical protein
MRAVITGGRTYVLTLADAKWLDGLRESLPITEVLHGDATGADAGAKKWAGLRRVPCRALPAAWGQHGKSAGPKRNQQMADEADVCIAFAGGIGTADMIRRAEARGLIVLVRPAKA